MNHLETLFKQNGWEITLRGNDYLILDAKGNQCVTTHVRVISPDEIAIGHPLIPDVKMNTRVFKSLPVSCRGNLTDERFIEQQKVFLDDQGSEYNGHKLSQSFRRSPHSAVIYHGSNAPND
jgi:hypothetical protein